MSNNQRDTQFQGFAKALMSELLTYFGDFEDMEKIIARRAYDLVEHTLDHAPVREWALPCQGSDIPDLTELPKEQDDSASIYESLCNDEGVMQVAIQITKALEPPRNYDNFGRIISFSEGPEPPKEQD